MTPDLVSEFFYCTARVPYLQDLRSFRFHMRNHIVIVIDDHQSRALYFYELFKTVEEIKKIAPETFLKYDQIAAQFIYIFFFERFIDPFEIGSQFIGSERNERDPVRDWPKIKSEHIDNTQCDIQYDLAQSHKSHLPFFFQYVQHSLGCVSVFPIIKLGIKLF